MLLDNVSSASQFPAYFITSPNINVHAEKRAMPKYIIYMTFESREKLRKPEHIPNQVRKN